MKIRLNYAWQHFNKGDVVDLGAAVAEAMTRTGQASYLGAVQGVAAAGTARRRPASR